MRYLIRVNFKEIKTKSQGGQNLKISGSKLAVKTNKRNLVKIIPLMETIRWSLGFNYVYRTVEFVYLSTHEKADRAAFIT